MIKDLIRFLFYPPPQKGDTYVQTEYNDPWADNIRVLVVDVRNGWVRYQFMGSLYHYAEKVRWFNLSYVKEE